MVIASIDIQAGKVVQLRQGSELVLLRDNAAELAEEFDRYGEVAVIDLDAAMGKGSNLDLIKPLLRKAECRLGGGIRSPEQARELVSLGARKIIAGSSAFRKGGKGGAAVEFGVNTEFLEAMGKAAGRERLVIAVDARRRKEGGYEIAVDGWKTLTGLELVETARAVEPYAGELLFTCVDREGTMGGLDLEPVRALREALSCGITVAGGVASLEETENIAALGCDVQLGMALYTGRIDLGEAFVRALNWGKAAYAGEGREGLLPLIAQDSGGQVLMTGFADREALAETFKRGNLCFHSRSRDKLWMKGENSGNVLKLRRLRADCDRDAILALVEPAGPACHTGAFSCFQTDRSFTWEYLQRVISERFANPPPGSYTASLDDERVRRKLMEEAYEVCTAPGHDEIVWEAADLLYFATVLMSRAGVTVAEVLAELDRRHKK